MSPRERLPYASPYTAGVGLGLVLLASYVFAGRGLGASGAFAAVAASAANVAAPASTQANPWFASRLSDSGVMTDWLVVEIVGVIVGGFISAWLAGRVHFAIERGPRITARPRLVIAAGGGLVMGAGAVFARGCTSGQALTGGALLSAGSWLFVAAAFGAGFLTMYFARRAWT